MFSEDYYVSETQKSEQHESNIAVATANTVLAYVKAASILLASVAVCIAAIRF